MIVFSSRSTHNSILGQYDDTRMTRSHADFILGTDHTVALHATQLTLLDHELLVAIIEHAAQISHDHLLSCGHVRRATNNL